MPRRQTTALLAGLALLIIGGALPACSTTALDSETTAMADVDLSNPELLERLGVPNPTITWQRRIERLTYVGSGTPPSEAEVLLVATVVDDIPTTLLEKLEVRYIVRADDSSLSRPDHPSAVAYAVGPDVYLRDGVFALSEGGSTRYDIARAIIHELVHVAQYQTMSNAYVEAALAGEISRVDPVAGSTLVANFAEATGWSNHSSDELHPTWALDPGSSAASAYGATGPGEDMAETVALVLVGQSETLPTDRVRWVEEWLGAATDTLAMGQPWVPQGAVEVLSLDPLFDSETVESIQGSQTHAEPIYFELPIDLAPTTKLVADIENGLHGRVMAGTMEVISDNRVPRYGGRFIRPDGTLWWVELWDFRHKTHGSAGPNTPVLVYVAIW